MTGRRDLAASVKARLLSQARRTGDDFQTLLTTYALERFLYRLSQSRLRDRFVLKGALLLRLWTDQPYRATRDLDLLRRGDGSFDAIRADIEEVCASDVEPDGVVFDEETIRVEAIRALDEYAGTRVTMIARCGSARIPIQIDLGLGDAVWPRPSYHTYPALLDLPTPELLVYPREAVVAEKLEALVVLGDRNSRIKAFFDLHHLAAHFSFERVVLFESVRRTFARRETPVPATTPIGLTRSYWDNPSRPAQMRAFARRARLTVPRDPARELGELLASFLLPVLADLGRNEPELSVWQPGGPWQPVR